MLYTYTPESVGGIIIFGTNNQDNSYNFTGKYYSEELYFGDNYISIRQREKDGLLFIQVIENHITKKIISNTEFKFDKHPTDNYYYPVKNNESLD